jgi:hypothetical protein
MLKQPVSAKYAQKSSKCENGPRAYASENGENNNKSGSPPLVILENTTTVNQGDV